jgi:CheY-like chemotaxis protein
MLSGQVPVILVVEDEPLVAMAVADCVTDAGCRVLGPVGDLSEALKTARAGKFDAALLDANLGGKNVDELATLLAQAGIPFAFVTGYGRDILPDAFRHVTVLTKPYDDDELKQVIRDMVASKDGTESG